MPLCRHNSVLPVTSLQQGGRARQRLPRPRHQGRHQEGAVGRVQEVLLRPPAPGRAAHQPEELRLLLVSELRGDAAGDRGDVPPLQRAQAHPQHRGVHPQGQGAQCGRVRLFRGELTNLPSAR